MFRLRATAVAVALGAALAVSGCIYDDSAYYSSGYVSGGYDDRYYADYSSYRQAQWDSYGRQRQQMIERERLAAQSERLRLERERLAWEKRELERLRRDNELRAQWERDKARYNQQHRQQPKPPPAYSNSPKPPPAYNPPKPPSSSAPSPGYQYGGHHGGSSSGISASGTPAGPGVNKPAPRDGVTTPAATVGTGNQPHQREGRDTHFRPKAKAKDEDNKPAQDEDSASTSEKVDRGPRDMKSNPTFYRGRGK